MAKSLTAGVIIFNEAGDILLCHATETQHWDIPKGMNEAGETPRDAALRELVEETGIVLEASRLNDLGVFDFRSDKALHLFALRVAAGEVLPTECRCTSMFPSRRNGRLIPEMDGFAWIAPSAVADYASGSLTRLFERALPLASLFDRLPPMTAVF